MKIFIILFAICIDNQVKEKRYGRKREAEDAHS